MQGMGENSVKKYLSGGEDDNISITGDSSNSIKFQGDFLDSIGISGESESVSRAVGVRSVIEYLDGSGDKTQNLSIDTEDTSSSGTASPGQTPFFVNGDYNRLENLPIRNLIGRDSGNFIVWSGLDIGNYTIKGYYKKSSLSRVQYQEDAMRFTVIEDLVTHSKVLYYMTIEDSEFYINKIQYSSFGDIEREDKKYLEGVKWEDF